MREDSATRREALAFIGVDPTTGKTRPIQLAYNKIRTLPRLGAGKIREAGSTVREVLARPAAVFRGLMRDADEPNRGSGWLCYVGRPSQCFEDDGRSVAPPPDRVFLVFVNEEWIAYNWYWSATDADNSGLPDGHAQRFKEQLL